MAPKVLKKPAAARARRVHALTHEKASNMGAKGNESQRLAVQALPGSWRACPQCGTPRWIVTDNRSRRTTCWMAPTEENRYGDYIQCKRRLAWRTWNSQRVVEPAEVELRTKAALDAATRLNGLAESKGQNLPDRFWLDVHAAASSAVIPQAA